jgi:hypothetical protein
MGLPLHVPSEEMSLPSRTDSGMLLMVNHVRTRPTQKESVMGNAGRNSVSDIKVDTANLYREDTFTDLKVASIRRLTPVKLDGTVDESRQPIFTGETHVMTGAGPVPIECHIEGKTLEEAMANFPEAIQEAIAEMAARMRELQRQEASRIIVPKAGPGGKIQLG